MVVKVSGCRLSHRGRPDAGCPLDLGSMSYRGYIPSFRVTPQTQLINSGSVPTPRIRSSPRDPFSRSINSLTEAHKFKEYERLVSCGIAPRCKCSKVTPYHDEPLFRTRNSVLLLRLKVFKMNRLTEWGRMDRSYTDFDPDNGSVSLMQGRAITLLLESYVYRRTAFHTETALAVTARGSDVVESNSDIIK